MKYLFGLLLISSFIISCKKNHDEQPPVVVVSKDSLLVSNVWQIKHIHVLQNSTIYDYERGGQNNTFNYDNDFLKFEKNGTGTYLAGSDSYEIDWQFDNAEKTEISYTIHDYANGHSESGVDLEVKLENVVLSESSFRYAEIYTNENGAHAVCSVYREPKPIGQ